MNSKLKSALIVGVTAIALNTLPAGFVYACTCYGDAAQMYASVIGTFTSFATKLFTGTGTSAEAMIEQSGAAVRAEVLKSATTSKAVEEGLEAYRQQQDLQLTAVDLQETMRQSPTTCQSLATSGNLSAASQNAQAKVFSNQTKLMSSISGSPSTIQKLESTHLASNKNYCTPEEQAQGICTVNAAPAFNKLAGADRDASFLFQSESGSASYDGLDTPVSMSPQSAAVDSYIGRVIAGLPPEQLRQQGESFYRSSAQARAYVELSRRYEAMLSMGAYSLQQIKEAHNPQPGLGTHTKMDTAPGFPVKADMSTAEVIERFVATKFSPASVQALATADSTTILRDMAQMSSFQLEMSYEGMLQSSRTEGLMAHQLALLADQVLRPQIDAQRVSATRAEAAAKRAQ